MKTQRSFLTALFVAATSTLLLCFQNCSQTLGQSKSPSASPVPLELDPKIPFPFEARPELLGFMSCSAQSPGHDRNQYFTFRLQANPSGTNIGAAGGVKLTTELRNYFSANGMQTVASKRNVIALSSLAAGATPQLSLRDSQLARFSSDTTDTRPADFVGSISLWDPLSETTMTDPFIRQSNSSLGLARYNGVVFGLNIDLSAYDLWSNSPSFIDRLSYTSGSGDLFLTLGFNPFYESNSNLLIAPPKDEKSNTKGRAYAQTFQFSFSAPFQDSSFTVSGRPSRVIAGMQEKSIVDSPRLISGWVCDGFRSQFKIAPSSAAAVTMGCPNPASTNFAERRDQLSPELLNIYLIANQLLNDGTDGKFWNIDAQNKCIYPAQGNPQACYRNAAVAADNAPCSEAGENGVAQCPHYFSFCTYNIPY